MAEKEPPWGPFGVDEGSMVLTKKYGLVRIRWVHDNDLVWDGEEFVRHGGVVFLGSGTAGWHDGLIAAKGTNVYTEQRAAPVPFWVAKRKGIRLVRDGETGSSKAEDPGKAAFTSRLYTIKDCGPRHRFACNGAIVHNMTTG